MSDVVEKDIAEISKHYADKQDLHTKNRIYWWKSSGASNLVTSAAFNTNFVEVRNKIPNVKRVFINIGFDAEIREVENKISNVSGFVTNNAFNWKISNFIFNLIIHN